MKKYGYIRVSSRDQNTERQMDALLAQGLIRRNIYVDHMSGKDFDRPEYKRLLSGLRKGDLLVIKSIDRLGRNYSEILEQWRLIIKEKGADIEVLDMPLLNTTNDQNGLTGVFIADLVLQILAYVAETERSFILQRQREGIESAKKRGVKFGRPVVSLPEEFTRVCQLYDAGKYTVRSAAKLVGMSPTTFYRKFKEYKILEDDESRFKG